MIDGIRPVLNLIALAWWKWALSEIDPMHPDVPGIVTRINELENA